MTTDALTGIAEHLFLSETHGFSKSERDRLEIEAGVGIKGDVHAGVYVKHRSRAAKHPTYLNRRQVHLLPAELLDELNGLGFEVMPGALGENVTTRGLDLINLPRDSIIALGDEVRLRVEGLRNPCSQIEDFMQGLLPHMFGKDAQGEMFRKTGIMTTVFQGGVVEAGAVIEVTLPPQPHEPLKTV